MKGWLTAVPPLLTLLVLSPGLHSLAAGQKRDAERGHRVRPPPAHGRVHEQADEEDQ